MILCYGVNPKTVGYSKSESFPAEEKKHRKQMI